MMTMWWYVAVGGALGALARYLLSGWIQNLLDPTTGTIFPWGTLVVNLVGCLAMGVLAVLVLDKGLLAPPMRTAVLVGLLPFLDGAITHGMVTLERAEVIQYR